MQGEKYRPSVEMAEIHASREQEARIGATALGTEISGENEEKADLEAKANSFLRRHGRELALFSKDSKLTFVPSASVGAFTFYPREFKVEVPLSWFASKEYNEDEINFLNHHEIAHFIDMRKNPDAFLENFEYMKKKAESLAKDYLTKHPGKASLGKVKKFFYGEIHSLYNFLDDIYVNNLVLQRNKFFDSGDGQDAVISSYEKLGFKEADQTKVPPHPQTINSQGAEQTKIPLHYQMINSLIRDEMLGSTYGKSIVDTEVEEVLNKKKLGKTIREIIDRELKPRQGILVDPEERYKIIRALIEPEYLKLLEVALEEQEEKDKQNEEQQGEHGEQCEQGESSESSEVGENGEQGEGEGNSDNFNPFGDNKGSGRGAGNNILDHGENGDQIMKDILDAMKEANEIDKMSPEEREKYQSEKRTREFDEQHGISKQERAENDRIKTEISKSRKEMRKFWERLIGKSIEYRQTRIQNQRRGRLNVRSFIDKYPDIIDAQQKGGLRDLEIYDKPGLERLVVDQPETIDVTLLVDCSSSMDSSKVEAAKKAAALLMYSIKDFNDELEKTRRETHSKLRANTEVIRFGSDFDDDGTEGKERLKKFDRGSKYNDNDASIIKSVASIDSDRGTTDDAAPLGDILSRLTSDERAKIQQGKLKKILFEITDGQPDEPSLTAKRLNELAKAGVIVVGFQIGDVNEGERETFQGIWNSGQKSENKQGIFIGSEIDKLPSSLMRALADSLNNIII